MNSTRNPKVHIYHKGINKGLKLCLICNKINSNTTHCSRCHNPIFYRKPNSINHSLALLLTAFSLLLPMHLLYISMLTNQGSTTYDNIYSGIAALFDAKMYYIGTIVFIASIVIPFVKVLGLLFIILIIKTKIKLSYKQLTITYNIIKTIGKWSMLDLFVISIMVGVINIGQLLNIQPGPAANYLAIVIIITQIAAKTLDIRLLWDKLCEQSK